MARNFRQTLEINEKKTKAVIAAFVLIYFFIGLILDLFLLKNIGGYSYDVNLHENLSFSTILYNLISFKNIPYFTLTMVFIAIISVFITIKFNDKISLWGSDYKLIDIHNKSSSNIIYNNEEKQLYNIVEELKISANLKYMPKVYLINAPYPNAFASGYSEKSAMVAITTGLIKKLNRSEIQAVMAHELSHIKHMDIKLTLFVGVLSNILLIIVDLFFRPHLFKDSKNNNIMLVILALRIILPLLTTILILFLSRTREYMADAGAIKLTRDPEALASALEKISDDYEENEYQEKGQYVRQSAYIFSPKKGLNFVNNLFSTHPPIEERIASLRGKK